MDTFATYFELGLRHIVDFDAFDHMLFILALVCAYQMIDVFKILILITAFTVGHSLTLILATTGLITVNGEWIEFLIPLTILITAVGNLLRAKSSGKGRMLWPYGLAVFFGLIHGMGFSNYLRMLLSGEGEMFVPLLAFNVGVEVGQVAIVIGILLLHALAFRVFRFKHRDYILVISGGAAGMALILMKAAAFW